MVDFQKEQFTKTKHLKLIFHSLSTKRTMYKNKTFEINIS